MSVIGRRLDVLLVFVYSLCLFTSLTTFLNEPNWRVGGVAWNALFQMFGPTVGSSLITLFLIRASTLGDTPHWLAIATFAVLAAASAGCLYWSMPVLLAV